VRSSCACLWEDAIADEATVASYIETNLYNALKSECSRRVHPCERLALCSRRSESLRIVKKQRILHTYRAVEQQSSGAVEQKSSRVAEQ